MVLNHNIGVNLSDATSLDGHGIEDFSMVGHQHSAGDITTGIMNPARLPIATLEAAGIVSLTNAVNSDSQQLAPTAYALASVYRLAYGKADTNHSHNASSVTGGTLGGVVSAQSNTSYTTKQVRNIILSPQAPSPEAGENGDIWLQYEP